MVWWLVKECFSAMIRPLWLTAPSGGCVAVKFSTIVSYLLVFTITTAGSSMVWWLVKECFSAMVRPLWLTAPSGGCVAVKFTIVSYLLVSTNHRRFKHGVVVNEKVFSAMIRPYYGLLLHLLSVLL